MEKKNNIDNTLELNELVYAPLKAVSDANIRLSTTIVDFLQNTGDVVLDSAGKPVVHLKTIQMLYDQIRNDSTDGGTVSDCIGLEIPLLSIYPLSSLKVSKSKISFDVEIKSFENVDSKIKIITQVCSNNQRSTSNQPKFSYEVELDSAPIPEGLARFIDTLNIQANPRLLHSKPVDDNGKKLSGKILEYYEKIKILKEKEIELQKKSLELKEIIRTKTNVLKLETGMDFDEYKEHLGLNKDSDIPEEIKNSEEIQAEFFEIEEYRKMNFEIEEKIKESQKELLNETIHNNEDESDFEEKIVLKKEKQKDGPRRKK